MGYSPTRRASCLSRSLSLACKIPILLLGLSETNTIGYYATLRLPPGPLGVLRLSLVPRYLACSSRSWCPRRARGLVEAPNPRQGLWSPGPPVRDVRQGARGLSQVPEFPLWTHAPLSDPGGVLGTRQSAPRTAAFRPLKTVG